MKIRPGPKLVSVKTNRSAPDVSRISQIDLEDLGRTRRPQTAIFTAARDVYERMARDWAGDRNDLLRQAIGLMERFAGSDRIEYHPPLFNQSEVRRQMLLALNRNKLVQHVWQAINAENTETLTPIFDSYRPDYLIRLTDGAMLVLEVKGQDIAQDRAKRAALDEWVRCVNAHGGFGHWECDVSWLPGDVGDALLRHSRIAQPV